MFNVEKVRLAGADIELPRMIPPGRRARPQPAGQRQALAHAWLTVSRSLAIKGGIGADEPGMIGFTLPEIRRLLSKLVLGVADTAEHIWAWSRLRRRRQHQARLSHYQRRGYPIT